MTSHDATDERARLANALSDRYEIVREIGRGGMATVYLARDIRHDRRVAIKVFNHDLGVVLGADRFIGEIRVTAQLQHPHVLPLFDSGQCDGSLYYVMPFVDGESLRARLDREGQLPVHEAVRITAAIADAAEHAHAHGIVHRDLKPENILLQSGQPVVMDFGIALAVSNAAGPRLTQTGVSLGTPQYMSPEQATGSPNIDARADIYAMGAIAYEMLVGEPPHSGPTAQAVIARVVTEPARSARDSRSSVPEHVDAAISRALEKLPADRFSSAREFADALQDRAALTLARPRGRIKRHTFVPTIIAAVASLGAIVAGVGWWRSAATHVASLPIRFEVDPPAGVSFTEHLGRRLALSPDGRSIAFASSDARLFIRRFDRLQSTLIPGVNAQGPELHFSGDGKWLAYWDRGPNRIAVGPDDIDAKPARIARVSKLGAIVAHGSQLVYLFDGAIWSVPSSGGSPRKLVAMDSAVDSFWGRPVMLPDSQTVALSVRPRETGTGSSRLAFLSLTNGKRTLLDVPADAMVGFAEGILTFVADRRLMGVRLRGDKLIGEPVLLLPDVSLASNSVTMASDGTLAYLAENRPASRIEIVDELGAAVATSPEVRAEGRPVVSPDGKRIAFSADDGSQVAVWIYDVDARVMRQLTQSASAQPIWAQQGKRVAFMMPGGRAFWTSADGGSAVEPVPGMTALPWAAGVLAFSPDGAYAIAIGPNAYASAASPLALAIPLGGGAPVTILDDAESPRAADVSPNGKWIAYESRETGRHEVFIRPFPAGAGKVQVSTDGGDDPQWSPDGRKLYYRRETAFRAVTLDVSGPVPRVLRTDTLFSGRNGTDNRVGTFSVHPDGKHFVVTHPLGDPERLTVVANFLSEVRPKLTQK